ncbi:MAG TPA: NifU family protein [Terriglobales bacterium]|nr:NifU family protein [Terriglobales bacterium]
MTSGEFQGYAEKIERAVGRVNDLQDDGGRTAALELMQSLMDLHGAAMARIVEVLSETGDSGRNSLASLGGDALLCGLMVLYGVHPWGLEERVRRAIENVRPQVQKQGGKVELLDVSDSLVRVSLSSSGNGCHSSPDALKSVIEQAIREAAPEVIDFVAEGVASSAAGFISVEMIQPVNAASPAMKVDG